VSAGRESSQFALLAQRRFAPFFVVQFLGAFNNNVFKNALIVLVTGLLWPAMVIHAVTDLVAGDFAVRAFSLRPREPLPHAA